MVCPSTYHNYINPNRRGAGTTMVPDNDVTAAASREAVTTNAANGTNVTKVTNVTNATNATNTIGPWGARVWRRMTWVGVCLV